MDDDYNRPVSRGDLLFTVEMALRKAERLWPKKRLPGDHDRLRPVAEKVVEHLELCRMRCFAKAPPPRHSIPDPWGTLPKSKGDDEQEGPPEAGFISAARRGGGARRR